MISKKNPMVDVGRNSSLYFAIGLNVMLFFSWFALNYKTYNKDETLLDIVQVEEQLEEEIPITNFEMPPPPPPPPSAPEIITVVEDVAEIEETIIETTETSQDEKIEEVVAVEDVSIEEVEEEIEVPFAVIEKVPVFPGCEGLSNAQAKECFNRKMMEHVSKNFKYPDIAQEMGIQGKVFVLFAIDSKGEVTGIRTRGPDKSLEKEASRIVSLLPKMIPGQQRGKSVRVPYSLPIVFQFIEN